MTGEGTACQLALEVNNFTLRSHQRHPEGQLSLCFGCPDEEHWTRATVPHQRRLLAVSVFFGTHSLYSGVDFIRIWLYGSVLHFDHAAPLLLFPPPPNSHQSPLSDNFLSVFRSCMHDGCLCITSKIHRQEKMRSLSHLASSAYDMMIFRGTHFCTSAIISFVPMAERAVNICLYILFSFSAPLLLDSEVDSILLLVWSPPSRLSMQVPLQCAGLEFSREIPGLV